MNITDPLAANHRYKDGRLKPFKGPTGITPQERADDDARRELQKNLLSRTWRMNNLYFIVDEAGNKVKFKPNLAQSILMKTMWYFNIILKARQLGFTTFICILFLDTCLFREDTHTGIIAHNLKDAENFFTLKVRYAYNNLPQEVKDATRGTMDSTRQLSFANGSSIFVGTSMRSGTLYMLHISEFGKVCARTPEKAREIVTGGINTVHAGQYVFIESTAEGRSGYFYDFCTAAKNRLISGIKPNKLQFKFYFFPWWQDPRYTMVDDQPISKEMREYFETLADKGIMLTKGQMSWYVAKAELQQDDMKREYPSTPEEAFEASIVGAYYGPQMTKARKEKRIAVVPHDPLYPVQVGWDIGFNDKMALWFHQRVGADNRLIHYFEGSGEGLEYYVKYLNDRKGYIYGAHYMPHDGNSGSPQTGVTFQQYASNLGLRNIVIVPRAKNQEEVHKGIAAVRMFLGKTRIDKAECEQGIKCLDNYKKEWDANLAEFKKKPKHDWASNGSDALRSLAVGYHEEVRANQEDLVPEPAYDF